MPDVVQDRQCVIDSLPVPVVLFHLVPTAPGEQAIHWAASGLMPSKQQTIGGDTLHRLVTVSGVKHDYQPAPARAADLTVTQYSLSCEEVSDLGYNPPFRPVLGWPLLKIGQFVLAGLGLCSQDSCYLTCYAKSIQAVDASS